MAMDCIGRDNEQTLDLVRLLRLAINLTRALGHAHQRGLIDYISASANFASIRK